METIESYKKVGWIKTLTFIIILVTQMMLESRALSFDAILQCVISRSGTEHSWDLVAYCI